VAELLVMLLLESTKRSLSLVLKRPHQYTEQKKKSSSRVHNAKYQRNKGRKNFLINNEDTDIRS
jgi:hypothetical protein